MKLPLIISIGCVLVACGQGNQSAPPASPLAVQGASETVFPPAMTQAHEDRQSLDDDAHYAASIDRISETFSYEQNAISKANSKTEKEKLHQKYCATDEMVDSRGGVHAKRYCLRSP